MGAHCAGLNFCSDTKLKIAVFSSRFRPAYYPDRGAPFSCSIYIFNFIIRANLFNLPNPRALKRSGGGQILSPVFLVFPLPFSASFLNRHIRTADIDFYIAGIDTVFQRLAEFIAHVEFPSAGRKNNVIVVVCIQM